jgi:aspartyl-tRNA synthetase
MRRFGGLLFIDLADHYGVTQVVVRPSNLCFAELNDLSAESVITCMGEVVAREANTMNYKLHTGAVELVLTSYILQSRAEPLPIPVVNKTEVGEPDTGEDLRLRHRYLDLRKKRVHENIVLRSNVIRSLREAMQRQGFLEIQTPILTASSPEGARDYLVPSRLHPGKFYALPQAPQMFKQLLMVGGFDRYFQIAPCFRDEAGRSDRSPGEFYQLDLEMAFAEQEDVFKVVESVLLETFGEHANGRVVHIDVPRIPYREAMKRFASDKPDLRNPYEFKNVSNFFRGGKFGVFAGILEQPGTEVWAIEVSNTSAKHLRTFQDWALKEHEQRIVTLHSYDPVNEGKTGFSGPLAKAYEDMELHQLLAGEVGVNAEDGAIFIAGKPKDFYQFADALRTKLGREGTSFHGKPWLDDNEFRFCWIVDFPMYEEDENGKIEFSHNPFSMPQGGMEALESKNPLDILAYQYDIVCNGVELSSGAIRNHRPDIMYKAFEIAGYTREHVDEKFSGMINAFKCGAPPHGGSAPGVDRIVMLLANEPNIREVIAFPMNQQAEDLMMGAPSYVEDKQLKELHLPVPKRGRTLVAPTLTPEVIAGLEEGE